MLLANGETPPDMSEDATAAYVARVDWSAGDGHTWVVDCLEDCEGWFSWSPCDVCRCPLGGDRHPVALIER